MAGWHHPCNEHELGQTLGDGERQGGLACCSPRGCKESDTTGLPNDNMAGLPEYQTLASLLPALLRSFHSFHLSH